MMCDERLFGPQIEAFGPARPVSCIDIGGAETMEELAAHVLVEAPETFALAGLSMGGIVAMEVLRQAPAPLTGLALLDTNPLAERAEVAANRGPQMEKARRGDLYAVMRDEMKPNYLAQGGRREEVLGLCMDMAMDLGPEVFCRQSFALRNRPDQTETLARCSVPTLVLCGREDGLCPVERHEFMHGLIQSSILTIIEGAGHMPTLEKPQDTKTALNLWLRKIDNG